MIVVFVPFNFYTVEKQWDFKNRTDVPFANPSSISQKPYKIKQYSGMFARTFQVEPEILIHTTLVSPILGELYDNLRDVNKVTLMFIMHIV